VVALLLTMLEDPSRVIDSSHDVLALVPDASSFCRIVGRCFRQAAEIVRTWIRSAAPKPGTAETESKQPAMRPVAIGACGDAGLVLATRGPRNRLECVVVGPEDRDEWSCPEAILYAAMIDCSRAWSRSSFRGPVMRCVLVRPRDGFRASVELLPWQAMSLMALAHPQRVSWQHHDFDWNAAMRAVSSPSQEEFRRSDAALMRLQREHPSIEIASARDDWKTVLGGGGSDSIGDAAHTREIMVVRPDGSLGEAKLVLTEGKVDIPMLPEDGDESTGSSIFMQRHGLARKADGNELESPYVTTSSAAGVESGVVFDEGWYDDDGLPVEEEAVGSDDGEWVPDDLCVEVDEEDDIMAKAPLWLQRMVHEQPGPTTSRDSERSAEGGGGGGGGGGGSEGSVTQ